MKDITILEVSAAIDLIKGGKSPGSDGIPIEIYKTFQHKLITPLKEMFKDSLHNEILPRDL